MRKPEIDYRTFRLSKLNDPQFAHLKLLGGWIGYFIMYFLTENLIPAETPNKSVSSISLIHISPSGTNTAPCSFIVITALSIALYH